MPICGVMDRPSAPPVSSRLTVRKKNRRRPGTLWSRVPKPRALADACGRALRRSVPTIAALSIALAIGAGIYGAYRWVTSSPRFAITAIEIRGAQHIDADQLRALLPIHVGDNVFANLDEVARATLRDPWVASAEAHRVLPHTISIEITEHSAAALVELGDLYLADATGQPFKRAIVEAGEAEGLPIITGIERTAYLADPNGVALQIRHALGVLAAWRGGERPTIGEVHVDPHGGVTLHTFERAIAIQLGATSGDIELARRLHTFDVAWTELPDSDRARARAIHLARTDHVTVAFEKDTP